MSWDVPLLDLAGRFAGKVLSGADVRWVTPIRPPKCPASQRTILCELVPLPGSSVSSSSEATWMSADGTVVAGGSAHGAVQQAFRWTAESGVVPLGLLRMATSCGLQTLPAELDGRTLFGMCGSDAFRWSASSGIVSLGSLSGYVQLLPWSISADGNRITGEARRPAGDSQVFYWSADSGLLGLGFLPGDVQTSSRPVTGMSSDGATIVGSSSAASGASVAFRWTKASGMQRLAPLPGENQSSVMMPPSGTFAPSLLVGPTIRRVDDRRNTTRWLCQWRSPHASASCSPLAGG